MNPETRKRPRKLRIAFVAFVSFLHFALLQHLALDLFDEERLVGTGEAQVGGWDTMVLDVGRHVLVVGVGTSQRRVIRVRKRVVPVKLLFARIGCPAILSCSGEIGIIRRDMGTRDLVAIAFDDSQLEIEVLLHAEDNVLFEDKHPFYSPEECARRDVDQRRTAYARVTFGQGVDERLVHLW